jgi:hypothetical protein
LEKSYNWQRKDEKRAEPVSQPAQTGSEDAFMKEFGEEQILEGVENEQKRELIKTIKKNRETATPL